MGTTHHLEGRDGVRPDDAARIMVLLDRGGNDARHTDAVAAHVQRGRLAGFVQHGGAHGLAVFLAELEDVADLDAARDAERALAGGRGIARDHVAQVGRRGLGQVAAPVDAGEVRVLLVRAADEVRQREHGVVGVDPALEPDRPEEAGLGAGGLRDRVVRRHAQRLRDARQLLRLDGVQLVIAAHQQRDHAAVGAVDDQRLDELRGG